MTIVYKQWTAICLVNLCWFNSNVNATTAAKIVKLYGPQQSTKVNSNKSSNMSYTLQLAAFTHKQYAIKYRNKMASLTTEPVQLVYRPHARVPYLILVGPFANIETLQHVSHQLLSETEQPTQRDIINVTQQASDQIITAPAKSDRHHRVPVVTVSVGPAWSHSQTTQTILLEPDVKKTYASNNGSSSLIDGEIFLGLQQPLHSKIDGQLGVAVAGASNSNLSGDVWEDGNRKFNNYVYKYNINHGHVAIKGKLLSYIQEHYQPYISGSLGVGFNHAYDFSLSPKIYEEVPAPLFQANTTTAFTYTLGIGVQKHINANWQVGLGYEFADWGQSHLGAASGQTIGHGLSLSHLYTNELQLSLTYLPKGY